MKTAIDRLRSGGWWGRLVVGACLLGALTLGVQAQVVDTLGGGPQYVTGTLNLTPAYGFVNTNALIFSQYNLPSGITLDTSGRYLFVADLTNNAVRVIDLTGGSVDSFATNLPHPIDVAMDLGTNLYVLSQTDGLVRKFDGTYRYLLGTNNTAALVSPTAMALDPSGNIYVTELGGALKRINATNGSVTTLINPGTLSSPQGVEVLDNGYVAVSDTGNHVIRVFNPAVSNLTILSGQLGLTGTNNGPAAFARFNSPHHLAKAGGGVLVVADYGNHQVRAVDSTGSARLLYGIDSTSAAWLTDGVVGDQLFLAGFRDGDITVAQSRLPAGVVVDGAGNVFSTEQYYHLIRKVTATGLTGPSGVGSGGSTNGGTALNPPALSISPSSGYFPMGQTITVSSTTTNVYYTTDGTEPTTNSTLVLMSGGLGAISWRTATNDLTGLRVKAFLFSGTNSASSNVFGNISSVNEIGVPGGLNGPIFAGVGSTIVVPVVINLKTNTQIKTLQFRVEVTPTAATTPMVSDQFNALSYTTNDFIRVVTSDTSGGAASFYVTTYPGPVIPAGEFTNSRGALISFIGSSANYSVSRFAVVSLLKVPIPVTAAVGNSYSVKVLYPSATSDTGETQVDINAAATQTILVTNISYTVGDTATRGWYNAGDFGDGKLQVGDVNNALHASLGIQLPPSFTDAFDAMDAFPEDTVGSAGGDGQIRYLDWQTISFRQSHSFTNSYTRSWSVGGVRTNQAAALQNAAAKSLASLPGVVWDRHATFGALPVEFGVPGATVNVPVYVRVRSGATLAGLQFLATVVPENDAPSLVQAAQFVPAIGGGSDMGTVLPLNQVTWVWSLGTLSLTSQSSNLLGNVRFQIPVTAQGGQRYRVRFSNADGAPNRSTQYEFETRSAAVWVQAASGEAVGLISDEWKTNFFGSVDNPLAAPDADPDGDGFTNLQEYLAGTNPTNALSRLRVFSPEARGSGPSRQNVFQLLTAPGKLYVLECATNLFNSQWSVISTNSGDGAYQEFNDSAASDSTRFYRIRVLP